MFAAESHLDEWDGAGPAAQGGTYVTLELSGVTIGVSVKHVREILDLVEISALPSAPANVEGVIDIRGTSIPIVEIRRWLGLPHQPPGADSRIVVFELARSDPGSKTGTRLQPVGIFADKVRDVMTISASAIEPPPPIVAGMEETAALTGVARQNDVLVFLLDVTRLFGDAHPDTVFRF